MEWKEGMMVKWEVGKRGWKGKEEGERRRRKKRRKRKQKKRKEEEQENKNVTYLYNIKGKRYICIPLQIVLKTKSTTIIKTCAADSTSFKGINQSIKE